MGVIPFLLDKESVEGGKSDENGRFVWFSSLFHV